MLRLTNTLTGRKELFAPQGDEVKYYVCGMTPKFHPHVGHARLFVAADVLRRYLEYRGYRVRHVQNFTDIDDKIIERARLEGRSPEEVARAYTESYFAAMDQLNVQRAHVYPTVTGSMPAIIAFVQGLIERGYAYVSDGDVWFSVARFPGYGQLSHRAEALEEGLVGARKELEPGKRDPRDFALWKRAKPGEPAWESPWGLGRPGWHIECSTMVRETLGDTIDLHGGGWDLVFPHHENERAQSEALLGQPFVRYWVHVGLVLTDGEKMAHSLGNFRTVREVLARHDPMALRLYFLQTHYRVPLTFNEEALAGAGRGLRRLRQALAPLPDEPAPPAEPPAFVREARQRFEEAMDDDLNTAGALAVLFELAGAVNARRATAPAEAAAGQAELRALAGIVGLDLARGEPERDAHAAEPFIELLLAVRQELRAAKQWALADRIREGLRERGVIVEDTPQGPTYRFE